MYLVYMSLVDFAKAQKKRRKTLLRIMRVWTIGETLLNEKVVLNYIYLNLEAMGGSVVFRS